MNLQVKITDLEQEILDQKCLHKSHTKVLQAQIFDLEANNKSLSDKIASLSNYSQNRQNGRKRNQKGRSKPLNACAAPEASQENGESNSTLTLPIYTQKHLSSTSDNEPLPPGNSQRPPAYQNLPTDPKPNFRVIWGTQKSVTADCIKTCIAKVAMPFSSNFNIQTTWKPAGWWPTLTTDLPTISIIAENWDKIRGDFKWQLLQSLSERHSLPSSTPTPTDQVSPPPPLNNNTNSKTLPQIPPHCLGYQKRNQGG